MFIDIIRFPPINPEQDTQFKEWFSGPKDRCDNELLTFLPHFCPKKKTSSKGIDRIKQFLEFINKEIENEDGPGRHFQLEYAYFMRDNMNCNTLKRGWKYSVKPILEEYYFYNPEQIDSTDKFRCG
ncbi:MAG: hypothetical protein WBX01_17880 [Nitrososphaeraceae archaeon]